MNYSNRVDFLNNINCEENNLQLAVKFFEQTMGMYNIVGECNTDSINAASNEGEISFELKMHSTDDLAHLESAMQHYVSNGMLCIYERTFKIDYSSISATDVLIKMKRV